MLASLSRRSNAKCLASTWFGTSISAPWSAVTEFAVVSHMPASDVSLLEGNSAIDVVGGIWKSAERDLRDTNAISDFDILSNTECMAAARDDFDTSSSCRFSPETSGSVSNQNFA